MPEELGWRADDYIFRTVSRTYPASLVHFLHFRFSIVIAPQVVSARHETLYPHFVYPFGPGFNSRPMVRVRFWSGAVLAPDGELHCHAVLWQLLIGEVSLAPVLFMTSIQKLGDAEFLMR
jgi:hypothetical protein